MDLVRESLAITIVFALLWAALWLLRKKGAVRMGPLVRRADGRQDLEVMDKIRLTPQHSVHVVRVADRQIVVGVHTSGFTVLGEIPNGGRLDRNADVAGMAAGSATNGS